MKTEIARIPRRKRRTYWRSGVSPLPPDAGAQNNPASQGVPARYDYAPFGAVSATGDVTQPFQWSSEFYDSELGLVYYNYRHYSPTDGRWLSRDPIEEEGGRNLYAFVKESRRLSSF